MTRSRPLFTRSIHPRTRSESIEPKTLFDRDRLSLLLCKDSGFPNIPPYESSSSTSYRSLRDSIDRWPLASPGEANEWLLEEEEALSVPWPLSLEYLYQRACGTACSRWCSAIAPMETGIKASCSSRLAMLPLPRPTYAVIIPISI